MKIGFLFPGQGAQTLGMGKDLYEEYEEYRKVYENVKELTGIDVREITFENEELLNQTQYTQICILTMSLAILKILEKQNIKVEASMGLSLGEYSSLIYSNAISFEEGVKIVKRRGELMQTLCPKGDWSMAAIMGLEEEKVFEICLDIKDGFVRPANYNYQGQIVISGDLKSVEQAMERAKEKGAKRAIKLNTSGPFHTEKLINASKELRKELDKITIRDFKTKVIKNLDGTEYKKTDNIKDILEKHIISPVRFENGMKTMLEMGIDTFIEIGPGKTLSGFVKKTSKEVHVMNINDVQSLKNVLDNLM